MSSDPAASLEGVSLPPLLVASLRGGPPVIVADAVIAPWPMVPVTRTGTLAEGASFEPTDDVLAPPPPALVFPALVQAPAPPPPAQKVTSAQAAAPSAPVAAQKTAAAPAQKAAAPPAQKTAAPAQKTAAPAPRPKPKPQLQSQSHAQPQAQSHAQPQAQASAHPWCFPLAFVPSPNWKTGARFFGARRDGGRRVHAGCDLLGPKGAQIYAIADGTVVRPPYHFYSGTDALEIRHGNYIVRYGEILPGSFVGGTTVRKGQPICKIGRLNSGSSMLHFEMYSNGASSAPLTTSRAPYRRRADLIDPTPFLDEWSHHLPGRDSK